MEQRAVFQQKAPKLRALHLPDVWTSFPVVLKVPGCAKSAVCPEESKKKKNLKDEWHNCPDLPQVKPVC
jgi:hypothetical protein